MSRLTWYARRLRSMSPHEVAWRASRAAAGALPRPAEPSDSALLGVRDPDWAALLRRFRDGTARPVLLDRDRAADLAATHPEQAAAVVAAADRTLQRRFTFFGYPEQTLDDPIDWHRDPMSATTWPAVPSERINHRTSPGDPKWIWELNRLQHLPWLAQAWLITGADRYAQGGLDQLDSWLAQNPPGIGIAWRGAFEAGVRAISVAIALQGLRDSPALTPDRYRRAVRMLAESARRCWQQRSRFSSANNHLVGELAGLATVALLLPELAAAPGWERRALAELSVQAQRQILPDGAGAEQSVSYQMFTAELLGIVVALLRRRGDQPPPAISQALKNGAGYLAALIGAGDPDPRYGDDDEGIAVRLDAAPLRTIADHLAVVGAVTGTGGPMSNAGTPVLAAGWLTQPDPSVPTYPSDPSDPPDPFGQSGKPGPQQQVTTGCADSPVRRGGRADPPGSWYAPHGGMVVLRSGTRRITMDVGPLGYLSIAAHGHADALAVTVSIEGHDLIGDPGTASYYRHPEWRTAHRGTRAHATVCVDDTDQSVIGGAFLWTEHATVTVRAVDLERGVVDAEHDGYRRLATPVTHRRWLIAPPDAATVLVVDLLHGPGTHRVCSSWPVHPSLATARTTNGHLVSRAGVPVLRLGYAASAELHYHEVCGDEDTHLGWWSSRLECREPAWLLDSGCRAPLPLVLATVLQPLGSATAPAPSTGSATETSAVEDIEDFTVELTGDSIEVGWRERDLRGTPWRREVSVDVARAGAVTIRDERAVMNGRPPTI